MLRRGTEQGDSGTPIAHESLDFSLYRISAYLPVQKLRRDSGSLYSMSVCPPPWALSIIRMLCIAAPQSGHLRSFVLAIGLSLTVS
jgi:hypothetical protein